MTAPAETAALRLHIGCGPVILPGWVNIDMDHPQAQVHLDVTKGLPYAGGSVRLIYAEHFIEHLTRADAVAFLAECRRVLAPGGALRLSTPNLDELVDAYRTGDHARWGQLWQPGSACRLLNEAFYSWGHRFVYNRDELAAVLTEAGFAGVEWCAYRESRIEGLAGLETRPFHNELIAETSL